MGLRFRLKASFATGGFPPQSRIVLEALKRYGMMVADNGSNWFISGAMLSLPKGDAREHTKATRYPHANPRARGDGSRSRRFRVVVRPRGEQAE